MPSGKSIVVNPHLNTKCVYVCVTVSKPVTLKSEALHKVDLYKLDPASSHTGTYKARASTEG